MFGKKKEKGEELLEQTPSDLLGNMKDDDVVGDTDQPVLQDQDDDGIFGGQFLEDQQKQKREKKGLFSRLRKSKARKEESKEGEASPPPSPKAEQKKGRGLFLKAGLAVLLVALVVVGAKVAQERLGKSRAEKPVRENLAVRTIQKKSRTAPAPFVAEKVPARAKPASPAFATSAAQLQPPAQRPRRVSGVRTGATESVGNGEVDPFHFFGPEEVRLEKEIAKKTLELKLAKLEAEIAKLKAKTSIGFSGTGFSAPPAPQAPTPLPPSPAVKAKTTVVKAGGDDEGPDEINVESLSLHGVMMGPGGRVAILSVAGKKIMVNRGDALGAWRVASILPNTVVLMKGKKKKRFIPMAVPAKYQSVSYRFSEGGRHGYASTTRSVSRTGSYVTVYRGR